MVSHPRAVDSVSPRGSHRADAPTQQSQMATTRGDPAGCKSHRISVTTDATARARPSRCQLMTEPATMQKPHTGPPQQQDAPLSAVCSKRRSQSSISSRDGTSTSAVIVTRVPSGKSLAYALNPGPQTNPLPDGLFSVSFDSFTQNKPKGRCSFSTLL